MPVMHHSCVQVGGLGVVRVYSPRRDLFLSRDSHLEMVVTVNMSSSMREEIKSWKSIWYVL